MPFRLSVPLPGPVSYSRRIGGSKSGGGASSAVGLLVLLAMLWWARWIVLALLVVAAVMYGMRWVIQRQAARRAAVLAAMNAPTTALPVVRPPRHRL